MSGCYCEHDCFAMEEEQNEFLMWQGLVGPHYTPHVDESGNLSWSNNGLLPNPITVNIMGKPGTGLEISGHVESVAELPENAEQGEAWAVGAEEPYEAYCWLGAWVDLGPLFPPGPRGDTGPYFTPSVDSSGNLSWTNNGDLPNPETVNIKGRPGQDGYSPTVTIQQIQGGYCVTITDAAHPTGQTFDILDGENGDDGATFTPNVASNGDLSWSNDKQLPNPQTVNIKGPQGDPGEVQASDLTAGTPEKAAYHLGFYLDEDGDLCQL